TLETGDAIRFRAATLEEGDCAPGLLSTRIAFEPATSETAAGGRFRRGDVNGDGTLDLSDPVLILGFLYLGNPGELSCPAAAARHPAHLLLAPGARQRDSDLPRDLPLESGNSHCPPPGERKPVLLRHEASLLPPILLACPPRRP